MNLRSLCTAVAIAAFSAAMPSLLLAETPVAPDTLPEWLVAKLKQFDQMPEREAPIEIWQIQHGGSPAYYFVSPCCDQYNPLYSQQGRVLCHPTGGIVGRGDGKCPKPADRGSSARFVWKFPSAAPRELH